MKKMLAVLSGFLLLSATNSCNKSSSGVTRPYWDWTGELKAILTYSTGEVVRFNATERATLFSRLLDTARHDTILTISGSINAGTEQMRIHLKNITRPGTYVLATSRGSSGNAQASCDFVGRLLNEYYSTFSVASDAGSVTVDFISSDSVSGSFHAQMKSWEFFTISPGRQITVTDGTFKGHFGTEHR